MHAGAFLYLGAMNVADEAKYSTHCIELASQHPSR